MQIFYYKYYLTIPIIIFFIFCQSCGKVKSNRLFYLNQSDTVNIVGQKTCLSCHAGHSSFMHTGMSKSFNIATNPHSTADFTNAKPVYDSSKNLYYLPFLKDSLMFIKEFRLNGPDTVFIRTEQINYIIGSGQHTHSHMIQTNGYLYQAPITWYAQLKKWDLPPGFENGRNNRFERAIDMECMSCHNSTPEIQKGSFNKFINLPNGIECERCHGAGELHVNAQKKGNQWIENGIDRTIVNPKKLNWQQQMDLCQRCHAQGNAILKSGKQFTDFKPGMLLSDVFDVFLPRPDSSNQAFIMASHAERLQMSECFIGTHGTRKTPLKNDKNITCIGCHNPHISVKETPISQFNNACKNCHNSPRKKCSESAEKRQFKNNNCVSCHMPKNSTSDIPHVAIHDHRISIPNKIYSRLIKGAKGGIYAINNPNPADIIKIKAYLNQYTKFKALPSYLDSAEQYLNTNTNFDLKIQYLSLQKQWDKIIELATNKNPKSINDAWTNYRVSVAYKNKGKIEKAISWIENAAVISPLDLRFLEELSDFYILNNQLYKAEKNLLKSLSLNPKLDRSLANLGIIKLKNNQEIEAIQYFKKALKLNPDNKVALNNLKNLTL